MKGVQPDLGRARVLFNLKRHGGACGMLCGCACRILATGLPWVFGVCVCGILETCLPWVLAQIPGYLNLCKLALSQCQAFLREITGLKQDSASVHLWSLDFCLWHGPRKVLQVVFSCCRLTFNMYIRYHHDVYGDENLRVKQWHSTVNIVF